MTVFENSTDRVMVLMTAGNLSISQSIRQIISDYVNADGESIWTVPSLYQAAQLIGECIRRVHERDAKSLEQFGIDFNVSMIFGGQIHGERCRLFQMYSAGNFIESQNESTYFQIGEAKYGKPILDRFITPASSLDEGAKCALISMDSTLRSNISVGLPLDLLLYENDSLRVGRFVNIDERNQYFQMIRNTWGQQLRSIFEGIADPVWNTSAAAADGASTAGAPAQPATIRPPAAQPTGTVDAAPAPLQTLAQQPRSEGQH
jgi:putative proteasome-type protease